MTGQGLSMESAVGVWGSGLGFRFGRNRRLWFSNRQLRLLESGLSHWKQTSAIGSNRQFSEVSRGAL